MIHFLLEDLTAGPSVRQIAERDAEAAVLAEAAAEAAAAREASAKQAAALQAQAFPRSVAQAGPLSVPPTPHPTLPNRVRVLKDIKQIQGVVHARHFDSSQLPGIFFFLSFLFSLFLPLFLSSSLFFFLVFFWGGSF